MAGLNLVQLIGRLGKDPEIRSFQNGGRIAAFSLATSEQWKDKNTGERKERTEWHNISVSAEGLVGVVERFLKKGSQVYVQGQLQTRKWQAQDGTDRYTTEVVLRPFGGQLVLLDKREDSGGESRPSSGGEQSYGGGGRPAGSSGGYDDLNDSIPFHPEFR